MNTVVMNKISYRERSHKVGPVAKVGPCPFAVVSKGTGYFLLLALHARGHK